MWCSARPRASASARSCRPSTAPTASSIVGGRCGRSCGLSVASAGDVNGDGFDDLIVGALRRRRPGNGVMPATAMSCSARRRASRATLDLADAATAPTASASTASDARRQSGRSVASAGDVNGDGFDDLIIGAPWRRSERRRQCRRQLCGVRQGRGLRARRSISPIARRRRHQGFVIHGERAGDRSRLVGFLGRRRQRRRLRRPDRRAPMPTARRRRDFAGDSYVVFGKAAGSPPTSISPRSPPATAAGFVIHGERRVDQSRLLGRLGGRRQRRRLRRPDRRGAQRRRPRRRPQLLPATAMWCSARPAGFAAQHRSRRHRGRRRHRLRHPRRAGDDRVGLVGRLGRRRQRRRLRRPDRRGALCRWPAAQLSRATAMSSSARRRVRRRPSTSPRAGDGSQGFASRASRRTTSGHSVASAGDVNGDGFDDLIVGAPAGGPADSRPGRRQLCDLRLGHRRRLGQPGHRVPSSCSASARR